MERMGKSVLARAFVGIACLLLVAACGGSSSSNGTGPADNCPSFAGQYIVTTEIVSTDCRLGLHYISEPVTWTFVQSAPSCSFTMTNSVYPGSVYTGTFAMEGSQAKATWGSVSPTPTSAGYSLTYTAETLTIRPAVAPATSTISGSFAWSSGAGCTGTTDVCHGAIVAGCLNPN